MESLVLKKGKVNKLTEALSEEHNVFAPINREGVPIYSQIREGNENEIEIEAKSVVPPKSVLFPQTETLFHFEKEEEETKVEGVAEDGGKSVIFGVRPCDAQSFTILDKVFQGNSTGVDYRDPYYLERRKKSILIGMSCREPGANCFCTSVNGDPYNTDGLDMLLSDLGDKYYVEVLTDKGKKLVEDNPSLFADASEDDRREKENHEEKAAALIERQVEVEEISKGLEEIFEDDYWSRAAGKCLGCGICTYLCPTCHCFDIQDESSDEEGRRVRVWDSCMYSEYTIQASGYNPRPGRMNRLRNRVYHKYKYMVDNFDLIGCVGCGRCIDNCPADVDIIEVLGGAREVMGD